MHWFLFFVLENGWEIRYNYDLGYYTKAGETAMRKIGMILLALLLICGIAAAESTKAPDYIMEGYDGDDTGRTWDSNLFFTRMRDRTGVRFMYRQASGYSEWKTRVAAMIKGENLPDVLFKAELTPTETRKLYEAGVLIDLRPYITEENTPALYALLEEHPEWKEAISMPDGAIAALPTFNRLQSNDFMWINTQWLSRLGLKKPTTAEELTEVLRAFKTRDPNRNASEDEVPLTFIGMWELRFLGHAYGMIDNDYYISVNGDGKVTSGLASEQNRALLTWLHTLWAENLLDHNGFSQTDGMRQITDDSKTIPYGMIMGDTPLGTVPTSVSVNYDILEPLTFDGKQVYRDLTGDVIRGTFAITRECANPAEIMAWVDYLFTEEGALLAQYGKEGEEFSIDSQGKWSWIDSNENVANKLIPERTIGTGSAIPGIALEDFQLKYTDEAARRIVEMMLAVKPYSLLPYPYVVLSDEDAAELAKIQAELMGYAEQAMACFVTGDLEMNDSNWQTFCDTVKEKGLDRAVAIWQRVYDDLKSED